MKSDTDGPAVAVYAAVVYDVIAATNSSPQTTEINAKARSKTLMKWVHIGLAQSILFILLAFWYEPKGKKWRPLVGGGLGSALMYYQYLYARDCGIKAQEPPTEDYGFGGMKAGRTR